MRKFGNCAGLLLVTAMSAALAVPAFAQDPAPQAAEGDEADIADGDIVVTARRVQERLQDVPISITVFNQQQLDNRNIVGARDLANFTPSLSANARYGADNTTFTIRGFSQEQRTTATVGVYFADAVTPRGSGTNPGGDGAGPGYFFDLQNVQVLKGPQGTLFGRNTTGGAILLVPQKPTDKLEGYIEGSLGNYAMRRIQAVVNAPLGDIARLRFGIDRQTRDGYLINTSRIGPDRFADVDYTAVRGSLVLDITPELENYTVASYSRSETAGILPSIDLCFPNNLNTGAAIAAGATACAQVAREAPTGFFAVSNTEPNPHSDTRQWQVVNTTTWKASDTLTVKNIFSYAELRQTQQTDLFGFLQGPVGVLPTLSFGATHTIPGGAINAQSTLTEELQVQGSTGDDKLVYQFGGYLEFADPLGRSGSQQPSRLVCTDSDTFNCTIGGTGTVARYATETTYRTYALYAQATYALTEQLKLTGGFRYTWDSVIARSLQQTISFPASGTPALYCNRPTAGTAGPATPGDFSNAYTLAQRDSVCRSVDRAESRAPTWLIGLDFKPNEDVLVYGKYSRGYRQANVAPFAPDGFNTYRPERVDSYEIGTKASWRGSAPGHFNLALFYNSFKNQQLQLGFTQIPPLAAGTPSVASTVGIVNIGASKIYGLEADASISPFEGLTLDAAYAFVKTRLDAIAPVTTIPYPFNFVSQPAAVGQGLPFSPEHKLTLGAAYTLPLAPETGKITLGVQFSHQSSTLVVYNRFGTLPGYSLVNLHASWKGILGSPIDLSLFMNNVADNHYYIHANDSNTSGFVSYYLGEPRTFGARLRFSF